MPAGLRADPKGETRGQQTCDGQRVILSLDTTAGGVGRSLLRGILDTVGCMAASLAHVLQMPVASPKL